MPTRGTYACSPRDAGSQGAQRKWMQLSKAPFILNIFKQRGLTVLKKQALMSTMSRNIKAWILSYLH